MPESATGTWRPEKADSGALLHLHAVAPAAHSGVGARIRYAWLNAACGPVFTFCAVAGLLPVIMRADLGELQQVTLTQENPATVVS